MEGMLAMAASRDPLKAVELELLFGIRRWIEYATGMILIGVIIGTFLGIMLITALR